MYLHYNQLSGLIPSELGSLTNLQRLSLSRNRLTGPIPTELGDLSNLEELYLGGNRLVGCILEGLRDVADNDLHDVGLPFCDVLLSGLVINPGSLIPPFDSDRTDYTAVVGQSRVTVTPTNDHSATVQLLDQDRNEIADADGSLAGHQVDLGADITMISIKVISEDGRAIHNYTVQVNRASAPGAPVISGITPGGGSLTVFWTPPRETRGADIASYDLRHIESAAADKSDPYWTVVDDAWTGGPLSYTLTGLTGGAQYNVQVRAFHGAGAGPWSATAAGTPATASDCATGGAVSDPSNNPGLVSDCEALLAARDVLAQGLADGEPWLNWSADTPMAEWDGIGDDSLEGSPQRVTRLYLHGLRLDGSIPAALAGLTALEELYLHDNDLTDEIPAELGSLSSLVYLHAYNNDLSGEIPAALGNLAALRELRLDSNDLSGQLPPQLGRLTSVTRLWFADNDLSGTIPPEFGNMTNLDWLNLGRNNIGGDIPEELGNLSRLRRLYIYENDLSGPIPGSLGNLSRLTHIVAHANDLSGEIPPELGNLSNLVWMGLYDNDLTGEIPAELGSLAKLQRLYLTNNELSGAIPEELGNLSALTNLFLSFNYLSGQIPQSLGDLERLTRLRLAGNDFTGCLPAGLAAVRSSDADQLGLEVCSTGN